MILKCEIFCRRDACWVLLLSFDIMVNGLRVNRTEIVIII